MNQHQSTHRAEPAILYMVATPIGNLADITYRAVDILSSCDTIYCEDTRITAKLCAHYSIRTPLASCRAHNEQRASAEIIKQLTANQSIAYTTDAGTPCVSDPGLRLVAAVRSAGFTIVPIPGASSVTTLISASGIACAHFVVYGFLPRRAGKRTSILATLLSLSYPFVLFESALRLPALLQLLTTLAPQAQLVIGRELTKRFEEIVTGTPVQLTQHYTTNPLKGEVTVLVSV